MSTTAEKRIPAEHLMLPDQQVALSLPWERGSLSDPSLSVSRLEPVRGPGTAPRQPDAFSGLIIGTCTVLGRLTETSQKSLIAVRREEGQPRALVVMRRLDHPEVDPIDVRALAAWAATLNPAHSVRVFATEENEHGLYWVTELPSGATFSELSVATRRTGQALPLGLVLGAVLDAARAVAELHAMNVPHGLIREQSILVGFDGAARLLDTGMLRVAGQGQTWFELAEAMAPYFSPEQLVHNTAPDLRSDVFSLGAVLYEGLTRNPVRRGARTYDAHQRAAMDMQVVAPSKLNMTVPPALDAVVTRALSIDPSQRFASAREFAQALSESASAFVWRRDLRAQFVAKNFEARQREEAVLRSVMERLPEPEDLEPPPEPELDFNFEAAPDAGPPAEMMEGLTPMPPAPREVVVAAPMPLPAAPAAQPRKPLPAFVLPVAGALLGVVLGFGLSAALYVPPPPPVVLPPVVWLDDVAEESVVVEVIDNHQGVCLMEVCEEPAPALKPSDLETDADKKAKAAKRKRDNVPIPPWLRKGKR